MYNLTTRCDALLCELVNQPFRHITLRRSNYLPLLLFVVLLGECSVNPPDLSEHAAVCKTETKTQQPQAELD